MLISRIPVSVFHYGIILFILGGAGLVQYHYQWFSDNAYLASILTILITFVVNDIFIKIRQSVDENRASFKDKFYGRISDTSSKIENDIFAAINANISLPTADITDEIKNIIDGQCKQITTELNTITTTISSIECLFGRNFSITSDDSNKYITKILPQQWRDKYRQINPTNINNFMSMFYDAIDERVKLLKEIYEDNNSNTLDTASAKTKFNNLKSDYLTLFDVLDSWLLFIATKYKKR